MAVITISRQYGSGGDEIANRVCDLLGYRQFDKRLIDQAAIEAGLSDREIVDFSEESHKMLSFMDRLLGRTPTVRSPHAQLKDPNGIYFDPGLTEEAALMLVQQAVRSAHQIGGVVILGRGGQVILRNEADVFHVRIVAPLEDRIQRVKTSLKKVQSAYNADITARREAQDRIIERDTTSADYIKRFYQVDWEDPLLYHLMINTGRMTIEKAANLIAEQAHQLSEISREIAEI